MEPQKEWTIELELAKFGGTVSFLDVEVYKNAAGEWHTALFFKTVMSMHICYPLLATPRTFASISRMLWRIGFGRVALNCMSL